MNKNFFTVDFLGSLIINQTIFFSLIMELITNFERLLAFLISLSLQIDQRIKMQIVPPFMFHVFLESLLLTIQTVSRENYHFAFKILDFWLDFLCIVFVLYNFKTTKLIQTIIFKKKSKKNKY